MYDLLVSLKSLGYKLPEITATFNIAGSSKAAMRYKNRLGNSHDNGTVVICKKTVRQIPAILPFLHSGDREEEFDTHIGQLKRKKMSLS